MTVQVVSQTVVATKLVKKIVDKAGMTRAKEKTESVPSKRE